MLSNKIINVRKKIIDETDRLVGCGIASFAVGLLAFFFVLPSLAQDGDVDSQAQELTGDLVLVAGATGGTGSLVVKELMGNGYRVRAFVRDIESAREKLGVDIEYAEGDVRQRDGIDAALHGVTAIICAIGAGREDPSNGPEFVDYGGVKNFVEAAADAELNQFVLISSAGVTHEDHILNKMFDNVLKWKFKGEEAVRNSGVPYTIVRPGGLVNKPGGETALDLQQGDQSEGIIPRADVARILVAALRYPEALNKTFEVVGGQGAPSEELQSQFASLDSD